MNFKIIGRKMVYEGRAFSVAKVRALLGMKSTQCW